MPPPLRQMQTLLLYVVLLFSSAVHATDNNTAAAVFFYVADAGSNFIFTLNAVDNGDLYFYLSGSTQYSWLAIGIGENMPDSLMFVIYEGKEEGTVTLSPRIASHGNSEPSYDPLLDCTILSSEASDGRSKKPVSQQYMSVNAVCHNATSWDGGRLDLRSSSQPWMFAMGPQVQLRSDSPSASLQRHELYCNFAMDMTKATSSQRGSVPQANGPDGSYVLANTQPANGVTHDSDAAPVIHGILMCIGYILLYPLGALLLRLSRRVPVRMHWICQGLASIVVIVGFGFAISASGEYNRSRDYDDPHQVLGLILFAAVLVQLALGATRHAIFEKKKKTTPLAKVHIVLGPLIILLGIINGGLGLNLALASIASVIAYSVVVAVYACVVVGIRLWIEITGRRNKDIDRADGESTQKDDIPLRVDS